MARKSVDDQLRIYIQQMGLVPDQEIANLAGVSRAVVVNFRSKHNIPAYEGHRHRAEDEEVAPAEPSDPGGAFPVSTNEEDGSGFRGRRSALDKYRHLLGRIPDARVATMAGVTAENVRSYRVRRNIPAAGSREEPAPEELVMEQAEGQVDGQVEGQAEGTIEDMAHEQAEGQREGQAEGGAGETSLDAEAEDGEAGDPGEEWSGELGESAPLWAPDAISFVVLVGLPSGLTHRYVVLASDIAQAAQIAVAGVAARHPGAEVRSVERVAPMLDAEIV